MTSRALRRGFSFAANNRWCSRNSTARRRQLPRCPRKGPFKTASLICCVSEARANPSAPRKWLAPAPPMRTDLRPPPAPSGSRSWNRSARPLETSQLRDISSSRSGVHPSTLSPLKVPSATGSASRADHSRLLSWFHSVPQFSMVQFVSAAIACYQQPRASLHRSGTNALGWAAGDIAG